VRSKSFSRIYLFNIGECSLDLVLKYLPLIIFIYPILSWLDSRKCFSHNAKFYADRASSVKKYEEECGLEWEDYGKH